MFHSQNVANFFIVDEVDIRSCDLTIDFILKDCLFRAVMLTKNPDPNKHSYFEYDIGFDSR